MLKHTLPVLLASILLSGCASIISGTSQAVTIDSNVQGATVIIEGSSVGVTPFTGKIPRKRESVAVVSKPGYTTQSITLTTSFNPVAILSIVWDYSTTDCLTGACWEYAPNSYYVNLRPAGLSDATFRRDSELKAFAMTFFAALETERASGRGDKTEALRQEFFTVVPSQVFALQLDQVIVAAHGDAIAFGEGLASLVAKN